MGKSDAHNLKSEADILARQSRPQHNSTWVPKTRDWRYATGVIQHDDFDDAPKSRSVWDTLDYDYQASGGNHNSVASFGGSGNELEGADTTEAVSTPKSTTSEWSTEPLMGAAHIKTAQKPLICPTSVWSQVKKFKLSKEDVRDDGVEGYVATALIIRLCLTGQKKAQAKAILEGTTQLSTPRKAILYHDPTPTVRSPFTPATCRTAETLRTPHMLDSIEDIRKFPLFKRAWVDETYDFKVSAVRSKLRPANTEVDDLGLTYGWYMNAVPIDAIFPPGVPLSAKEINAFYPHHVRWKGVMVRLTKNDYRGADIMGMQAHFRGPPNYQVLAGHMNGYQRDTVKTALPGFKTTSYQGKSDRNLRTDCFEPGPHIQSIRKGYSLPTFDDLVRGLQRLPSGLDARGLTQSLAWYLRNRDSFTPRLELNVLHTQSLIRALREPLKPFGPQNLDRNALEEWRNKGTFEALELEDGNQVYGGVAAKLGPSGRTILRLNLDKDEVSMDLTLPIRHVFTFPFLALHGVVSEALKMGISKAENRQKARHGVAKRREHGREKLANTAEANEGEFDKEEKIPTYSTTEGLQTPYRTPKRPIPVDVDLLSSHKKPKTLTDPRPSLPLHMFAPAAPHPLASSYAPGMSIMSRNWNDFAPSSAYAPQQQGQEDVYGRRDYQAWQPDALQGETRPFGRSSLPGEYGYEGQTTVGTGYHHRGQTPSGSGYYHQGQHDSASGYYHPGQNHSASGYYQSNDLYRR